MLAGCFDLFAIVIALASIHTAARSTPSPGQSSFHLTGSSRSAHIVTPHLCNDNTTQYSGYLPNSPIFFWFFPSRSDPSIDPIGLWSNGGPGSSALTGMQFSGPCAVVDDGKGGFGMERNEWSFNDRGSILMIDNPIGAGFSYAPFPTVDNIFDSARLVYDFLQTFITVFPEYAKNPWAVNSLSYGGHYAPAYGSYIQHRNLLLQDLPSPWSDIWETTELAHRSPKFINLTSISVGNGWINGRVQYRAMIEFACGHAQDEGVPMLGDKEECAWAMGLVEQGEKLLNRCYDRFSCAAAGLYTAGIAGLPYAQTGLNPYDYRLSAPYNETAIISFYNTPSVQASLGVNASDTTAERGKVWNAHSESIWSAFVYSGDWETKTDGLMGKLLDTGVGVLVYEGMVDWICNYIGLRRIMSNIPNYQRQAAFNQLAMRDWIIEIEDKPTPAGKYKCLKAGKGKGRLCYLEIDGAGHVLSLDKPREGSLMISKWMNELSL
ncbi:uncharacterized protein I206_105745 [Kwoniella pini CBS 10737]|uniref:carboxypeptidase C n=1 Tax=Kwoniella pini CBS 10737 TaxID=1296096 RepID=A0A1B9I3E9_9TREE|nr:uncharacterized protein I206_03351 [Kwoniella pini CBS 10737]OCF50035.1 hypothetical protein I206_03351 [Kwoniella pini CBS 10737]